MSVIQIRRETTIQILTLICHCTGQWWARFLSKRSQVIINTSIWLKINLECSCNFHLDWSELWLMTLNLKNIIFKIVHWSFEVPQMSSNVAGRINLDLIHFVNDQRIYRGGMMDSLSWFIWKLSKLASAGKNPGLSWQYWRSDNFFLKLANFERVIHWWQSGCRNVASVKHGWFACRRVSFRNTWIISENVLTSNETTKRPRQIHSFQKEKNIVKNRNLGKRYVLHQSQVLVS